MARRHSITDRLPSQMCVSANAHALGRYAALCQEQDIVPIVEPEVLMEGNHTIEPMQRGDGQLYFMPCSMHCTNTTCCSKACCSSLT